MIAILIIFDILTILDSIYASYKRHGLQWAMVVLNINILNYWNTYETTK